MKSPLTLNAKNEITACSFCSALEKEKQILLIGDEAAICEDCILFSMKTLLNGSKLKKSLSDEYLKLWKKILKIFAGILILIVLSYSMILFLTIFRN